MRNLLKEWKYACIPAQDEGVTGLDNLTKKVWDMRNRSRRPWLMSIFSMYVQAWSIHRKDARVPYSSNRLNCSCWCPLPFNSYNHPLSLSWLFSYTAPSYDLGLPLLQALHALTNCATKKVDNLTQWNIKCKDSWLTEMGERSSASSVLELLHNAVWMAFLDNRTWHTMACAKICSVLDW